MCSILNIESPRGAAAGHFSDMEPHGKRMLSLDCYHRTVAKGHPDRIGSGSSPKQAVSSASDERRQAKRKVGTERRFVMDVCFCHFTSV